MPQRRVLSLLIFFLLSSQGVANPGLWAEPSAIRVKLLQTAGEFEVSAKNLSIQGQDFSDTRMLKIQGHQGVGGVFWSVYRNKQMLVQFKVASLELRADSISINKLRVPKEVQLKVASTPPLGNLARKDPARVSAAWIAVAQLELDEYLSGVLKGEMPQSWPLDALRAQAIVARTFTLYEWQRRSKKVDRDFDFESGVSDQVYVFAEKILPAVQQTHGLYLTSENGEVSPTYFHSDCGGNTESANYVWGGTGRTQTVKDDFCPFNPKSQWTLLLSPADILNRLLRAHAISTQDKQSGLKSFEVVERNPSSRVQTIRVKLNNEKQILFTGQALRQIFGFASLKSTMFSLQELPKSYLFSGKGAGHGVGLCQWGSRNWAQRGFDFKKILAHYFPQSVLRPILDPIRNPTRVARAGASFEKLQAQ